MPVVFREVLTTDTPNTGRGKYNQNDGELASSVNALELTAHEVWVGATPPPTPHNYKAWVYIPASGSPLWRRWDGAAWQDMSVGPAGRGFTPRGAWATATQYYADNILTHNGGTYRVKVDHVSTTAPADGTTYELWAAPGATGGFHAASHVDGADQTPTATTTSRGLMGTAQASKLDGIQAGAQVNPTAPQIRDALVTVDGAGSGIDTDLIDGLDSDALEQVSRKGIAGGYASLGANGQVPPAQLPTIPTPSPWSTQAGADALFAATGDGNPVLAAREMDRGSVAAPANARVGATTARIVKFRLPKTLALGSVNLLPITSHSSGSVFRFAIYPVAAGSAILWDSGGPFGLTAGTWLSLAGTTGVALNANTDYWFCFLANSDSTTAFFRTPHAPLFSTQFGAGAPPLGGRSLGIAEFAQIPLTTAGVFPATLPTIAAAGYGGTDYGTLPVAFLRGTAS